MLFVFLIRTSSFYEFTNYHQPNDVVDDVKHFMNNCCFPLLSSLYRSLSVTMCIVRHGLECS